MSILSNLFHKIRLTSTREPYSVFIKTLGVSPRDPHLYELAFTHSSLRLKDNHGNHLNNERLEYLGDAVIETIVSHFLYNQYPNASEGFLTSTRSKLVCRETLNEVASQCGFHQLLKCNVTMEQKCDDLLGNAFEAVVGAIFLDLGYSQAEQFIHTHLLRNVNVEQVAKQEVNFKSRLLELTQRRHMTVKFTTEIRHRSLDDSDSFYTTLFVNSHHISEAWGTNKKKAEQRAARYALQEFKAHPELINKLLR